jgi:hypothetical protein
VVCLDRDPDLRRVTKHKDYQSNISNIQQNIIFVQGDVARIDHVMALFKGDAVRWSGCVIRRWDSMLICSVPAMSLRRRD